MTWKREITGWAAIGAVAATLYFTGLHTEAIGRVQQLVLATGIAQPSPQKATIENSPALPAYDFPLTTLDGKKVNLKDFKGKVIFLNIWATWCPPCIAEMPSIHNLYQEVAGDDIAFVMLSVDENPEKAKKFIARKGYTFPVYTSGNALPAAFRTQSIPTTFVIAPDGTIALRHEGMARYNTAEFRTFLTQWRNGNENQAVTN